MSRSRRQRRFYARVTTAVLYCGVMVAELTHAEALQSLDALRWDRRVLLIHATVAVQEDVLDSLESGAAGLRDRDVTWLMLDEDHVLDTNHPAPVAPGLAGSLRRRLEPIERPLDVLLIGKDGGLKFRDSRLDLGTLFELIDGMPMRRREIEAESIEAADRRG